MIGFYPVCPGKPEYVIGIPAFNEVQIKTSNKSKPFTIRMIRNQPEHPGNGSVTLNGLPVEGNIIQHRQIIDGGELIFQSK
jgi:putative alpha-1,2-mannosidase